MDRDKLQDVRNDLLKSFKAAVEANTEDIQTAMKQSRVSTVAWLARNLLELGIWIRYCAESPDNAKEFVLDAARDVHDAMNVPDGVFSNTYSFKEARAELIQKTRDDGFETLDEKYTPVYAAAKHLGQEEAYKCTNKLLSKFAHPTALLIVSSRGDSAVQDMLKNKFYALGIANSNGALAFLEQAIRN